MADTQMPDCPPMAFGIDSPDPVEAPAGFSRLGLGAFLLECLHEPPPPPNRQHAERSSSKQNTAKERTPFGYQNKQGL